MFNRRLRAQPGDESTAKALFFVGFLGLPLLWLLNYGLFRNMLPYSKDSVGFCRYVRASLFLGVIATASWVAWLCFFYIKYGLDDSLRNFLVFTPRPYYD